MARHRPIDKVGLGVASSAERSASKKRAFVVLLAPPRVDRGSEREKEGKLFSDRQIGDQRAGRAYCKWVVQKGGGGSEGF